MKSSERLDTAADIGQQAVWTAELADSFVLAMIDYTQNDYASVQANLETFFNEAGYPGQDTHLAETLTTALQHWEEDDQGAAVTALVDFSATLLQTDFGTADLLSTAWKPLFEYLMGYLELANANDVIPTLARSLVNMSVPEDPFSPSPGDARTQPAILKGRVLDHTDTPVENATVSVYTDDPRDGAIAPYMTDTTDPDGVFGGTQEGPDSQTILYFTVSKDGQTLTETPWSEVYKPTDPSLPDQSQFSYTMHLNTTGDSTGTRPEVGVSIDIRETTPQEVRFRLQYEVATGTTEVMPWHSSGGVHARIPNGTFETVDSGDFANQYFANMQRDGVSSIEDASIVEFTTDDAHSGGATLSTGDLVVSHDSANSPRIAYRSWGWDTDRPITVDGTTYNFIARAPAGPQYNRHEFDTTYTFLAYPTRVWTRTQAESLPPVTGENPPQDLDDDDLYEDIDGDGDFTIGDVQLFFQNRHAAVIQDNAASFNFSGNNPDEVTISDVQALFQQFQERR